MCNYLIKTVKSTQNQAKVYQHPWNEQVDREAGCLSGKLGKCGDSRARKWSNMPDLSSSISWVADADGDGDGDGDGDDDGLPFEAVPPCHSVCDANWACKQRETAALDAHTRTGKRETNGVPPPNAKRKQIKIKLSNYFESRISM